MKKISILVANKCFGSCEGCYLDKRYGKELSVKQIINFAKLLKELKYEAITLSGGDPLIRKDIGEIISLIKKLGFIIHLDTIGKPLLDESFRKYFKFSDMSKSIDLIGIPFDGSTSEIFECFRTNTKNMNYETLKILELLNKNKFIISINTVVHKGNINDLNNIYLIITNFSKVVRWELHQFVPLSKKAKALKRKFEISGLEFSTAVNNIKNNRNIIVSPKLNKRKLNFLYLDFNGNFIRVKNGIKSTIFNIYKLSNSNIKNKLKSIV